MFSSVQGLYKEQLDFCAYGYILQANLATTISAIVQARYQDTYHNKIYGRAYYQCGCLYAGAASSSVCALGRGDSSSSVIVNVFIWWRSHPPPEEAYASWPVLV